MADLAERIRDTDATLERRITKAQEDATRTVAELTAQRAALAEARALLTPEVLALIARLEALGLWPIK